MTQQQIKSKLDALKYGVRPKTGRNSMKHGMKFLKLFAEYEQAKMFNRAMFELGGVRSRIEHEIILPPIKLPSIYFTPLPNAKELYTLGNRAAYTAEHLQEFSIAIKRLRDDIEKRKTTTQ